MTYRTIKSPADAAKPEDLLRGQSWWYFNRTSALNEYKPYLDDRCTNAWEASGGDRPARLPG